MGVTPTVGAAVGSGKDVPVVFLFHLHRKLDFQPLLPGLLNRRVTEPKSTSILQLIEVEMGKGVFPYCAFKLMSKG